MSTLSLPAYHAALRAELELLERGVDDGQDVMRTLDWIRRDYPDEWRRLIRTMHHGLTARGMGSGLGVTADA